MGGSASCWGRGAARFQAHTHLSCDPHPATRPQAPEVKPGGVTNIFSEEELTSILAAHPGKVGARVGGGGSGVRAGVQQRSCTAMHSVGKGGEGRGRARGMVPASAAGPLASTPGPCRQSFVHLQSHKQLTLTWLPWLPWLFAGRSSC